MPRRPVVARLLRAPDRPLLVAQLRPGTLHPFGAAAWDGRRYVHLGGLASGPLRYVGRLDDDGEWRDDHAGLPEPIGGAASCFDGTRLLLFGGYETQHKATAAVWSYDLGSGALTPLPPLPEPRMLASAVWTGKRALLFGGRLQHATVGRLDDAILSYDPKTGRCERRGSLPSPRAATGAFWDGKAAYVVGGETWALPHGHALLDEVVKVGRGGGARVWARLPAGASGLACAWDGETAWIAGLPSTGPYSLAIGRFLPVGEREVVLSGARAGYASGPRTGATLVWRGDHAIVAGAGGGAEIDAAALIDVEQHAWPEPRSDRERIRRARTLGLVREKALRTYQNGPASRPLHERLAAREREACEALRDIAERIGGA